MEEAVKSIRVTKKEEEPPKTVKLSDKNFDEVRPDPCAHSKLQEGIFPKVFLTLKVLEKCIKEGVRTRCKPDMTVVLTTPLTCLVSIIISVTHLISTCTSNTTIPLNTNLNRCIERSTVIGMSPSVISAAKAGVSRQRPTFLKAVCCSMRWGFLPRRVKIRSSSLLSSLTRTSAESLRRGRCFDPRNVSRFSQISLLNSG